MRTISWARPAVKDLKRLDKKDVLRVRTALNQFAAKGIGDVRKLKTFTDEYRLRIGSIRVRFISNDQELTITVLRVLQRDEIYKR